MAKCVYIAVEPTVADDIAGGLNKAATALETLREALQPLLKAAEGLSHGVDWNNGTHAKLHGYRRKLLAAIPKAREALSQSEDCDELDRRAEQHNNCPGCGAPDPQCYCF